VSWGTFQEAGPLSRRLSVIVAAIAAAVTCSAAGAATPSGFGPAPAPGGPGSTVNALAAASHTDVWAVGAAARGPLVARWDGSRWRRQPAPVPSRAQNAELLDVDLSGPANIWAVGDYTLPNGHVKPLVERSAGRKWRLVTLPDRVRLDSVASVSVRSSSDIWLFGYGGRCDPYHVLVYHYDGTAWRQRFDEKQYCDDPDGDEYTGIHAVAFGSGLMVGGAFRHEDGNYLPRSVCIGHHCPPRPHLRGWGKLQATAGGGDNVWIVGERYRSIDGVPVGAARPRALHWDGSQWQDLSPKLPGRDDHVLLSAATVRGGELWAVGYRTRQYADRTLIMHWDGTAWSDLGGPNASAEDYLTQVVHVPGTPEEMWALGQAQGVGSFLLHHP
jgi:hypothetical protein